MDRASTSAVLASVALLVTACAATPRLPSSTIAAAVSDPGRPAADILRDANRKPAELLAFFQIKQGQTYFPTMCPTSFSFSMHTYSVSSVPVTNSQFSFTVHGLV